jgi:hypothetical protein
VSGLQAVLKIASPNSNGAKHYIVNWGERGKMNGWDQIWVDGVRMEERVILMEQHLHVSFHDEVVAEDQWSWFCHMLKRLMDTCFNAECQIVFEWKNVQFEWGSISLCQKLCCVMWCWCDTYLIKLTQRCSKRGISRSIAIAQYQKFCLFKKLRVKGKLPFAFICSIALVWDFCQGILSAFVCREREKKWETVRERAWRID